MADGKNEELLLERKKLKEVINKLTKEEEELEIATENNLNNYQKDDFVKAQLDYLNNKKLSDIKSIKPRPYFARIDFTEYGSDNTEKLYIGKLSVLDPKTKQPLIVDWRAPVSNLYYDGSYGKAKYETDAKTIEGTIGLKRQYFIEDGNLNKMLDINNKVGSDTMLQEALEGNASSRLKNIVATIQEEQNRIIRAPMNKPLIIQGVAGSGKTTIALHRIAYLIYKYAENCNPETFMIIAPNKFFLNYISNILPDLGVDNVNQYTFEEFANEAIGTRICLNDDKEKLVSIVNKSMNNSSDEKINLLINEAKLKSSMKFKYLIDKFLKKVEDEMIPKKDFIIANTRVMRYETINSLFKDTYSNLPIESRIKEVRKHMESRIRMNLRPIVEGVISQRSIQIQKLMKKDAPEKILRRRKIELFNQSEKLLQDLYKGGKNVVNEYLSSVKIKTAQRYYRHFIDDFIYDELEDKDLATHLKEEYAYEYYHSLFCFEDIAPIVYIHEKVYGSKFSNKLKHVVIDEAQDYGEFQFFVIKQILKSNSITILGDLAQGVYSYRGIENWKSFSDIHFPESKPELVNLNKSYRTTNEIIEVANKVISNLPDDSKEFISDAQAVIKSKGSVEKFYCDDYTQIAKFIARTIRKCKHEDIKSVAIIGKDLAECRKIVNKLGKFITPPKLITNKDSEYDAGVCVLPSYLAKGLEFDYVIIVNADEKNYTTNPLDIKLLYVAITRAMKKIDIYCIEKMTELIE